MNSAAPPPLRMQQVAAVAIDRERDDRIGKATPVPVEIEEGVGEGMRERMMQRLVGRVDAALDQPGGEVVGRLAVAVQFERPVGRLTPPVRPAAVASMAIGLPWL